MASSLDNLLDVVSSAAKIEEFIDFVLILHERTGYVSHTCNLGLLPRKLVCVSVRAAPEKINEFVEIYEQNREQKLVQTLFVLFRNKETAFKILCIPFIIFLRR